MPGAPSSDRLHRTVASCYDLILHPCDASFSSDIKKVAAVFPSADWTELMLQLAPEKGDTEENNC